MRNMLRVLHNLDVKHSEQAEGDDLKWETLCSVFSEEEEDDDDSAWAPFLSLPPSSQLNTLISILRGHYSYCFYCSSHVRVETEEEAILDERIPPLPSRPQYSPREEEYSPEPCPGRSRKDHDM